MGTNIYIRRKKPRMVPEYDTTHVAKLSYGWRVMFDGSSMNGGYGVRIGSIDDLRACLATGEWELIDEYDEATTLDEVMAHNDNTFNIRSDGDYYDREGNPWTRSEFS